MPRPSPGSGRLPVSSATDVPAVEHVSVLAVDCSPTGSGRTRAALAAVLDGAATTGASVSTLGIADDIGPALEGIVAADAIVLGSPVYRASYAAPLKALLDAVPRSNGGRPESPLTGKPVAIVYTGATLHHFLAPDSLRSVLAGFFAAHVLPPGLYVPRHGFTNDLTLVEPYAEQTRLQGGALVELVGTLRRSVFLRDLRPQA
jgi:FMN reductase